MLREKAKQFSALLQLKPFDDSTPEGRSKERYRRIVISSTTSLFTRSFTMLASLIIVPLTLNYLGSEQYALWASLTSFVTWIALFDFGIISGLVNALSEANGKNDQAAASGYVSSAFFLLIGIVGIIAAIFIGIVPFVNWASVFAVEGIIPSSLVTLCVIAAVAPVLLGMPFSIVRQIYAGYQKIYIGNAFYVIGVALMLIGIYLAVTFNAQMPVLLLIYGGATIVVSIINMVYIVKVEMPWLRPRLRFFSASSVRRLMRTSVPLFLFQLGALLINSTQPIILAHRTDLDTVTDYSIWMRLFTLTGTVMVLSTSSFLPTFRESYERGEHAWMRTSFKRMMYVRMSIALAGAMLVLIVGNEFLSIWLRQANIQFSTQIWIATFILMVVSAWSTGFSELLTIMDKIWVQVVLVLINGTMVILLTYWLSPEFGVLGAIVAYGFMVVIIQSWLNPILTRPILQANRSQ